MRENSTIYFHSLACNNAWSNHRLLEACSKLSPEAFAAKRTSFFPSMQATLNHILTVDWYYVDGLEGGSLGGAAWKTETPCPDFADLDREQRAVDKRLIALCRNITAMGLAAPVKLIRPNRIQTERADRVLLHLFEHQIHHRGQAHAMLAGTPLKPPQLDEFFLAEEAPLRETDFAALEISEREIWGDLA